MKSYSIYYATNRRHEGSSRWNPDSYGKIPSSDGAENLRFGEVTVKYNENEVERLIEMKKDGRKGNGIGLGEYLSKQSKGHSTIRAYEDFTAEATQKIPQEENPSFQFFLNLKSHMMQKKDVIIYIHGFNVSWDEAVGGAIALEMMLNSNLKGAEEVKVILFSWPSNGSMMPYAAYISDRSDARNSGNAIGRGLLKLNDFMDTLEADTDDPNKQMCHRNINLLCHSMGNFVLENAVKKKLIGYSKGGRLPGLFKNIFLCAPDVDDEALEPGKGLGRLHEMASNVTVYYNDGDMALHTSKYTKHFSERLGHTGNARPSKIHNKVHQVDCSPIVKGFTEHSYYLWGSVNKDIAQTIEGLKPNDSKRKRKSLGQNREWEME